MNTIVTILNGLIGLLIIIAVPYTIGKISNVIKGNKSENDYGEGLFICILVTAAFFAVYLIGIIMESLKIALI